MSGMQATSLGWAPAIPSSWKVVPLNFVAKMGTGHTPDRNKAEYWESCTIPWVTTPDVTRRADSLAPLMETEQQISELGMANSAAVLHPTDTVMLSRTASVGYSVRIGRPMATTQAFVTWQSGPDLDPRYLLLVLRAMRQEWRKLAYGSTHLTIYMPDLESIQIPLPPLEEQRRIADFLDGETARIDALVAHRYRQSELFGERFESLAKSVTGRTALRSRTLPNGWSTQQLRRTIKSLKTGTTPSSDDAEIWADNTRTDTAPWYGPSNIGALLGLTPSLKRLPRSAIAGRIVPKFPSGSILVIGIGATAGKVAYLDHEGTGNQQITALVPEVDMVGRFLAWQLWAATDELRELAPYTTLPIINNDFLKSFPIAVPPAAHQRVVVKRLDLAASRLRALERTSQQATSLLAERRQALITAAVTGQFDVSAASGRNVTDGVSA
jgi:type I restriction enzyme, S subunit